MLTEAGSLVGLGSTCALLFVRHGPGKKRLLMVDVGRVSSLANRKGAQPPPQLDGFGGGPSWSWLGHSGDVQHAERISALALCWRLDVVPVEGLFSVVVFAELGELSGPLGP